MRKRRSQPKLVIVDPGYQAIDGRDANNMGLMGRQLCDVAEMFERHGARILLIHHTTKAASRHTEPLAREDICGSGYGEWAPQWLLIGRRQPYRPGDVHRLWLSGGGRAEHEILTGLDVDNRWGMPPNLREEYIDGELVRLPRPYKMTLRSLADCEAEAAQTKTQGKHRARSDASAKSLAAMVEALADHPEGYSRSALSDQVGLKHCAGKSAIERGLADGTFQEIPDPRRTDWTLIRLRTAPDALDQLAGPDQGPTN